MQPIINLLILLAFPMVIAFSSASPLSKTGEKQYCNSRFNFCLEYPQQLFAKIYEADNGDGVRMASTDGHVNLEASGSYNVMNWDAQDLYFFYLEQLTDEHKKWSEISHKVGDGYFEAVFKVGDEIRYYKALLKSDSYITLIITVPEGMEELLNSVKDDVHLTIHI